MTKHNCPAHSLDSALPYFVPLKQNKNKITLKGGDLLVIREVRSEVRVKVQIPEAPLSPVVWLACHPGQPLASASVTSVPLFKIRAMVIYSRLTVLLIKKQ